VVKFNVFNVANVVNVKMPAKLQNEPTSWKGFWAGAFATFALVPH